MMRSMNISKGISKSVKFDVQSRSLQSLDNLVLTTTLNPYWLLNKPWCSWAVFLFINFLVCSISNYLHGKILNNTHSSWKIFFDCSPWFKPTLQLGNKPWNGSHRHKPSKENWGNWFAQTSIAIIYLLTWIL